MGRDGKRIPDANVPLLGLEYELNEESKVVACTLTRPGTNFVAQFNVSKIARAVTCSPVIAPRTKIKITLPVDKIRAVATLSSNRKAMLQGYGKFQEMKRRFRRKRKSPQQEEVLL